MKKVFNKPNKSHMRGTAYFVPSGTIEIADKGFVSYDGICAHITEIYLPHELKKIGAYAFHDCLPGLKAAVNVDTVESIGEAAFGVYNLELITLSNKIKTIEKHAFCNCGRLTIIIYGCGNDDIPRGWHKEWNSNCKETFSSDWIEYSILARLADDTEFMP